MAETAAETRRKADVNEGENGNGANWKLTDARSFESTTVSQHQVGVVTAAQDALGRV